MACEREIATSLGNAYTFCLAVLQLAASRRRTRQLRPSAVLDDPAGC
jgi:hypothetical protein